MSPAEAKELEEFVMDIEGVESVRRTDSTGRLLPGVIQASIPHDTLLITLASAAAGGVGGGIAGEAGKDIYRGAKQYIAGRLMDWKQARFPEARRRWIEFEFDENDELINRWRD